MGRLQRLRREAVRAFYLVRSRIAGMRGGGGGAGVAFYRSVWEEAAAAAGAELVDLGDGFLELRRNGARTRVWKFFVEIDHPVTLELSGNKAVVHRLLTAAGIPVPEYLAFGLDKVDEAADFAQRLGRDCVVKPLRGSGGGVGVTTHVRSPRQVRRAAYEASIYGRQLIIEEQIAGDVYRLLYLDGEFVDAVVRRPPRVTGDGKSSIRDLIEAENRRRRAEGGAAAIGVIPVDHDCRATLERAGLRLGSVPAAGSEIPVKGTSNAGAELESRSVRDRIGPELREAGARAANVAGVRLAGVDAITTDPSVSLEASGGVINEVNTTPGLHWHYRIANPEEGVKVAIPVLERLLAVKVPY
jgi:cyanophycin synthetase